MGRITCYHPVSLHVIRGAAEYCGFKFGKIKRTKSSITGGTATYIATIEKLPKRVKEASLLAIKQELALCFNADIRVHELRQSSNGRLNATIVTSIISDAVQGELDLLPTNSDGLYIE